MLSRKHVPHMKQYVALGWGDLEAQIQPPNPGGEFEQEREKGKGGGGDGVGAE